ncbi:RsmD family RNA methyltransferase [Maribacter chungangensis]|uniref:RsmD family RNA methyltransferase n=1 Tax=Maribacter chungangensis TaxID=1069117 RepID=A0ABW3B5D7_9FLAO
MNDAILHADVQAFINENLDTDILKLVFKKSPFAHVSAKELAEQIEAKRKINKKLPTWFTTPGIYFANKLNISQTSSEATATYKASLVDGNTLADLTAGFGVDTYAFSKKMKQVYHVETELELSNIAQSNCDAMKVSNVTMVHANGIDFLEQTKETLDWIYIDPSRRTDTQEKVYFLSDCEPDVTLYTDLFLFKCNNILIKTGPLLDLSIGQAQLKHVKEIHIIALNNEVKEVLWVLEKGFKGEPSVKAVQLSNSTTEVFAFLRSGEQAAVPTFSLPQKYLYEPNAAVLKSGAFKLLCSRFGVNKLHPHSHLYTASQAKDFPGRHFEIKAVVNYNKKEIQKLDLGKANISTRNFPDSVATIRKKLKLKDGGSEYLFFTKNVDDKLIVISCSRLLQTK